MNALLERIGIDDLRGSARELADVIGMEAFIKLVDAYGGTSGLYIPQADTIVIPMRDELIRREFDGYNYDKLARKWGLTDRYVREIVKEQSKELKRKPIDGQLSLW